MADSLHVPVVSRQTDRCAFLQNWLATEHLLIAPALLAAVSIKENIIKVTIQYSKIIDSNM